MIKLKILFVILLFGIGLCTKNKDYLEDMYPLCGNSYQTSDLYFPEDRELEFNIRFIRFADSTDTDTIRYDLILNNMNEFYAQADIKFRLYSDTTIVNQELAEDMPSYIKHNFKYFRNDSTLTCYIYSNYQPNYYPDKKTTLGSAGGLGANFFAVVKAAVYGITVNHETGHMFGLMHVDTPDESPTGYTIYSGDRVCDTRGVINLHEKVDMNCNYIGKEELTEEEKKILVCNFMSWNYLNCRSCITEGQIRRLRWQIHESPQLRMCIHKGLNTDM